MSSQAITVLNYLRTDLKAQRMECLAADMKHTFCATDRKAVMASIMPVADLLAPDSGFINDEQQIRIRLHMCIEVRAHLCIARSSAPL